MVIGKGLTERYLTDDEVCRVVQEGLGLLALDGKRVLMIIPDGTRTMPAPLMFTLFEKQLGPRVAALDYLIALGTHPLMNDAQLSRMLGRPVEKGRAGQSRIFNHHWEDPKTFVTLGTIPAGEVAELTGGLMEQEIPVRINKLIFDYDQVIICGPVFPHEIAGFSGGSKYLFPGISEGAIINQTHWAGALITNMKIIGNANTATRAMIDRAVQLIDLPLACFALVVKHEGISGIYLGPLREAWECAAKLSAQKHIVYVKKPFRRVLSVMPTLYDDFWTGGKGVYKLEPAVADGGEIVIYAPHIGEISYTHGRMLEEIGYHCRDYFVAQWDKFKRYPGGVLAHSSHVKGQGTYDALTGRETPRIQVTLATSITPERCRRINLAYADPAGIHPEEWSGREDEGILMVPRAGEMLYRVQ